MPAPSTGTSVHLSDYVTMLRRQWWVVVATVVVCLGLAVAYTFTAPREYTSTSSVLVTATGVEPESTSSRASTINMDTEAQIITSTAVIEEVADALGHTGDPRELAERVSISVPPNTEILDVSYRGTTAAGARAGAEAVVAAYLQNRAEGAETVVQAERDGLQARMADLNVQLDAANAAIATLPEGSAGRAFNEAQASSLNNQLANLGANLNKLDGISITPGRVITQAATPAGPSSPKPLMNLAAGGLLGLVAGLGLAVARWRSDRLLRNAADVERQLGLSVLADLQEISDTDRTELAGPLTPAGRSYARLRNVVTASTDRDSRVVLVAGVSDSAGPVAVNLAASLARVGEHVVLLCADTSAHTEADLRGRTSTVGLAEVLSGRAKVTQALRSAPGLPELRIIGAGTDRDLAVELLQTSAARAMLAELLTTVDRVVIEAPATTTGADAQTLAALADLAVVVVNTGATSAQDTLDAVDQFQSIRTPVLGAVVVGTGSDRGRNLMHDLPATTGAGRYRSVPPKPEPATRRAPETTATAGGRPDKGQPVGSRSGTPAGSDG